MRIRSGVRAGLIAAAVSGAPSTLHAIVSGRDPLESTAAAGSLLLPNETRRGPLILAAIPTHLVLSIMWAVALEFGLPRKRPMLEGAAAGLAIGIFDLMVVGRRWPQIRRLPLGSQLADHIAFGIATTIALQLDGRLTRVSDFR